MYITTAPPSETHVSGGKGGRGERLSFLCCEMKKENVGQKLQKRKLEASLGEQEKVKRVGGIFRVKS